MDAESGKKIRYEILGEQIPQIMRLFLIRMRRRSLAYKSARKRKPNPLYFPSLGW